MEPRLQRRVQKHGWDRACDYYERFWSRQLEPAQTLLLERLRIAPGERVADIACGTGLVSLRAAEAVGPGGAVVGTDLAPRMVRSAALEARARGVGHARFEAMDAEALDLPDASFDVALDALGLMYVPDPLRAVREMLRILRPGGRAGACVWGARAACGWAEIFPIVDRRVATDVCPLFFQLGAGDSLARLFAQAGLVDVALERLATPMVYETGEAALGAVFAGGPVALAYAHFDDATRAEAHAEYLASIEAYRDGDGYRIPGEFVVVTGARPR
jgi:SAM-dependent methyltransferase